MTYPRPGPKYEAIRRKFYEKHLPLHGIGVEIGVHKGDNFINLVEATKPKRIHAVDPWSTFLTHKGDRPQDYSFFIEQIRNRWGSTSWIHIHRMTSEQAADALKDMRFDWVYIDGDHAYDSVMQDLSMWVPLCRGPIAGHDYHKKYYPGVVKACSDFFGRLPDDISAATDWVYHPKPQSPNSGL